MTIANINIGTTPNDGTGDSLRTGFSIVNNNFSYVNSILGGAGNVVTGNVTANIITANIGTISNLTATTLIATTGNITTVNATNITGNIVSASQTYITTVGTLGNLTVSGNVTTGNVTTTNIVFASGFFYSNGVAVAAGSTGNISLTASNIAGANSNDGRGTVLNLLPNISQAANGQFLTLDATTFPNVSIKAGDTANATLILGQSTHGISILSTGSTGNIFINPLSGGITANTKIFSINGNINLTTSNANISGNGNGFNLISVQGTNYTVSGNIFDTNTATTVNVAMQPVFTRIRIVTANANVAFNFVESTYPIIKGTERVVYIRNTSAGNITVSNIPAYNNKGTTTTTLSSNVVGRFTFFSNDTTFGNIIATVTNN